MLREIAQRNDNEYLRLIPQSSQGVKDGVDRFCRDVQHLTVYQIYFMLNSVKSQPVFNSRNGSVTDHYVPVSESQEWAVKLRMFQYSTREAAREVVINLYKLLDRVESKRNSVLITGEANCGKTYSAEDFAPLRLMRGQSWTGMAWATRQFAVREGTPKRPLRTSSGWPGEP